MSDSQQVVQALPFTIASRVSERQSFTLPNIALSTSGITTPAGTPVQIPAVGYIKTIRVEFSGTVTGASALTADSPWNLISNMAFKNASGQNLIAPLNGYEWYLMNKYSGMYGGLTSAVGTSSDPKNSRVYSATTTAFRFFLDIPFELDPATGLGSLPAMASNRNYQLELSFNPITAAFTGATAGTISVDASVIYWDAPVATTPGGVVQQTEPFGLGTISLWQKENPIIAAGEQLTRSNNVGNVIRNLILVARTSAGVRTDADWTGIMELFIDNSPTLRLKKTEWQDAISRWYNYTATALDATNGLDTGVFVFPFHLLAGGVVGDPNNSHAQWLATLDATLLQFKGYSWGASIGTLAVLTQAISSPSAQYIYSK
ncbi:major capsid protein [Microbacterium phage Bee17]|nr:major capsid protein [Microbacterium phage Bee17]